MRTQRIGALVAVFALLLFTHAAVGQYSSGFEAPLFNGAPGGLNLNGQQGFYNPDPPNSVSGQVYTYAGNALGLPANPTGGDQFIGSTGPAGGMFSRSQLDIGYGNGTGSWTIAFDVAVTFTGQLPSAQNIGSFSSQLFPNEATFISLARWSDPNTAANWNADYVWFDAAGTQLIEQVADPGFQNLATNHWYRWSTTFDLDTNLITEVALMDLTAGTTVTNNPVGKYLWGGAAGAPPPSGLRFFAGSSTAAGNTMAFDNLDVVPSPASVALLGLAGLLGARRRRR
jgi:hypothetical protein